MEKIDQAGTPTRTATVLVASGRGVADRWREQYFDKEAGTWLAHAAKGSAAVIHERLCELGENPTPAQVAQVIGNKSWSYIRCDSCFEHFDHVARLGDPFSDGIKLCRACCVEAVLACGHD